MDDESSNGSVSYSADALVEHPDVEIHEQSQSEPCDLEVRQQLLLVQWDELLNRFEFHDDGAFDDEVDATLADRLTAATEFDRDPSRKRALAMRELYCESRLIDRLQKPGPRARCTWIAAPMMRPERPDPNSSVILEISASLRLCV